MFIHATGKTTSVDIMQKPEKQQGVTSQNDSPIATSEEIDLDRDAFLKILITQLRYQDPMNPMEDKEFIAQMAQFSSLEQMQQMNRSLNTFLESNFLYQASSLIGKEVTIKGTEDEIKGIVQEISFTEYGPKVILENGEEYPMSQIVGISSIRGERDDG